MRLVEFPEPDETRDEFPYDPELLVLELVEGLAESLRQGEHRPLGIMIGFTELGPDGSQRYKNIFCGYTGMELVGVATMMKRRLEDLVALDEDDEDV